MTCYCRWARRGRNAVQDGLRTLVCTATFLLLSWNGIEAGAVEGDEHWRGGFVWPGPGLNAAASAMIVYQGKLIVGGGFTLAGGIEVGRIAQWDGTTWSSLGSGVTIYPGRAGVRALTVHGDTLYAFGTFDHAGGVPAANFAAWDGVHWSPRSFAFPQGVQLVTRYLVAGLDDKVYVSGEFRQGTELFQGLAEWDGVNSRFLATANPSREQLGVFALAAYQGKLVAGGQFVTIGGVAAKNIATWDGTGWSELGGGVGGTGSVSRLLVYDGRLIVAGQLTVAGIVNNIAAWDGVSWHRLGAGTNGFISNLVEVDGKLVVSGSFTRAGGVETSLAQWDGAAWSAVEGWPLGSTATRLAAFGGELVVAGLVFRVGDLEATYIAAWDGNTWRVLDGRDTRVGMGLNRAATSFATYGEDLLVGGPFEYAGSVAAKGLALWDGVKWSSLGLDADNVNDIVVDGDRIFLSGQFVDPSNSARYNLAIWDGGSWRYMNAPMAFPNELIIHEEKLIVSGSSSISEWDGSFWRSLGPVSGDIFSLLQYDGRLIASGSFISIGGVEAGSIAQWDGTAWHPLGSGLADANSISSLEVHSGKLVAAVRSNDNFPAVYVAVWDGESWTSLPSVNNGIFALKSHEGGLFVGGLFTEAGGVVASSVARWDGTRWSPMGSGCDWAVLGFGSWKGELYVGGEFNLAGGRSADGLARWDDTPVALTVSDLQAVPIDDDVLVRWRTAGDVEDLLGFHVFREVDGGERVRVTPTLLHGNTFYEHRDLDAPAGSLRYWLAAVDRSGTSTWYGPMEVRGAIGSTALLGSWPSPFVSGTRVHFRLSTSGPAALDVYDVRGRLVSRLLQEEFPAGRHVVQWDGRDQAGRPLSPGIYFIRLGTHDGVLAHKLTKGR